MLSVTEAALNHLASILREGEPDRVLRLAPTSTGLALVADQTAHEDDEVLSHKGKALLVLDKSVAEAIGDQTLHVVVEGGAPRLTLR